MTEPPAPKNRYRAFYLRQLDKGLRAVQVWVPADRVLTLKDFARKLREAKCSE